MAHEHINPEGLFELPGFTQVVKASGTTVHISGQGSFDANMQLIGAGSYREQAAQAFRNIRTAVEAAGGSVNDVVSTVMYVVQMNGDAVQEFVSGMNEALDGEPFPPHASSLIGVHSLAMEGMLVEVSAVAIIPASGS